MHTNLLASSKLSLSQMAGIASATVVLCTGLLISLLTWTNLSTQLDQKLQNDAQRQLQRLTIAIAPSLLAQDRVSLNITLREWIRGPELSAIQVFDTNQQLLAEIGQPQTQALEISQAITQDNLAIGRLRADINLQQTQSITARYLSLGLIASLLCALLAGLLGLAVTDYFLAYVRKLSAALVLWHNSDEELVLPRPPHLPELQPLHHALAHMADQQQQRHAMHSAIEPFGSQQLPPNPELKYHPCALLFIEVHNLEQLQNELSAEQLTQQLSRYYQLLLQTAKLYHGRLERYAGNGAVLLFGLNHPLPEQDAKHCLYAAQLFLGLIQQQQRHDAHQPNVAFRLAAHWGDVLLAPIALLEPNRYDLIGDTLHWAAHLAQANPTAQVLVSQALHQHITEQPVFTWQAGEAITDLFGQQQQSWWLDALEGKQQTLIERQIQQIVKMTVP